MDLEKVQKGLAMDSDWYALCVDELKLPGSPWYAVSDLIAERLAYRIRIEGLKYDQLNAVSKFVGVEFMQKFHLYDLYESMSDTSIKSHRLVTDTEVQRFLKDLTLKAAKDCHCTLPIDSDSHKDFSEMMGLVKRIYQNKIDQLSNSCESDEKKREFLGHTLVKIVKSDPGMIVKVFNKMRGHAMPRCLRQYVYKWLLIRKRKKDPLFFISGLNSQSSLEKLRRTFASEIRANMDDLKIKNPAVSPVKQLVRSSVIQVFDTSPGLRDHIDDFVLQQVCCRTLNIVYTHKKHFEHVYALWILPLLKTFSDHGLSKENDYEVVMWFSVLVSEYAPSMLSLNRTAFLTWTNILKHSGRVLQVKKVDLLSILQSFDIATDEDAVKHALLAPQQPVGNSSLNLCHPVVFIRLWLFHLFVGQVDLDCSLFIWDQLFINNFSQDCFMHVCLSLVYSLADCISLCKSKNEVLVSFKRLTGVYLSNLKSSWKVIDSFLTA